MHGFVLHSLFPSGKRYTAGKYKVIDRTRLLVHVVFEALQQLIDNSHSRYPWFCTVHRLMRAGGSDSDVSDGKARWILSIGQFRELYCSSLRLFNAACSHIKLYFNG